MSAWTVLNTLIIDKNIFSSSLPPCLGSLANLIQLNVSYNAFTGTIPLQFHDMISMTYLDLSNNAFIGKLDGRVNNSIYFQELFVQNNAFSGRIDSLFSPLQLYFRSIDFSSNQFTGNCVLHEVND